jgi:ADP-heptose:LPS heptosyltransferase
VQDIQGELGDAIASYQMAICLQPDHADSHSNLAMAYLLAGDYEKGWDRYEWRFKFQKFESMLSAHPKAQRWGGTPLQTADKLLLVCEQGLGDTLHFMRYVLALKQQGIAVTLCAQPKLHGLIQASEIDAHPLTPEQANQFSDGQWIPLLSLPRHLGVNPNNPIITEPYLKTSDQLVSTWQEILSTEKKPIIGINWQGNPSHEKTNSKGRSLPLETFASIAAKTNGSLLSLQKGYGSEQLETCSFRDHFVSCQDQINETWDFLETAAIIDNCDLVITSDTSVAHLAGGMGKTTWLLLKTVPEWRWGLEGENTFWYSSMHLFRQKERGNWDEVMERVAEALQKEFPGVSA